MNEPKIAGKAPIGVDLDAGKSYYWCSCGRSGNQPFCDGSHKGTPFVPIKHEATESAKVFFCACKRTGTVPLCDGSHQDL